MEEIFRRIGAEFVTDALSIKKKLLHTHALLLDWDGVFNDGTKGKLPSCFSEVDSMGINMLRFGFYLQNNCLPFTAIITGEENQTALQWAQREHLNAVFFLAKKKENLLPWLKVKEKIIPQQTLFCFDDLLDIALARWVGTRWMVRRKANPLFLNYCKKHEYCDYITACTGSTHALREISEVALSLLGRLEETFQKRIAFAEHYQEYLAERNNKKTLVYRAEGSGFVRM